MTSKEAKLVHHLLVSKQFSLQELPLVAELAGIVEEVLKAEQAEDATKEA